MAGSNDDNDRCKNGAEQQHQNPTHEAEQVRQLILRYSIVHNLELTIDDDDDGGVQLVERCFNAMGTKYEQQRKAYTKTSLQCQTILIKKIEELAEKYAEMLAQHQQSGQMLQLTIEEKTLELAKQQDELGQRNKKYKACKEHLIRYSNCLGALCEILQAESWDQAMDKADILTKFTMSQPIEALQSCNANQLEIESNEKMAAMEELIRFYETFISQLYKKLQLTVQSSTAEQQLLLKTLDLDAIKQCLTEAEHIMLNAVQERMNNCETVLKEKEELTQKLEQEQQVLKGLSERWDVLNCQLQMDHNSMLELLHKLSINVEPLENQNVPSNFMATALEKLHHKFDFFSVSFKTEAQHTEKRESEKQCLDNAKQHIEELEQKNKTQSKLVNELQTKLEQSELDHDECLEQLRCQKLEGETLQLEKLNMQKELGQLKSQLILLNDEFTKLQNTQGQSIKHIVKLSQLRHELEQKVRRLQQEREDRDKVFLTYEIGALNLQIKQLKDLNLEQERNLSVLKDQLKVSNEKNSQIDQIKIINDGLTDRLVKEDILVRQLREEIKLKQENIDILTNNVVTLRAELLELDTKSQLLHTKNLGMNEQLFKSQKGLDELKANQKKQLDEVKAELQQERNKFKELQQEYLIQQSLYQLARDEKSRAMDSLFEIRRNQLEQARRLPNDGNPASTPNGNLLAPAKNKSTCSGICAGALIGFAVCILLAAFLFLYINSFKNDASNLLH